MYSRRLFILIISWVVYVDLIKADSDYTNTWAVEIEGGDDVARRVAEQHGYRVVRKVGSFRINQGF